MVRDKRNILCGYFRLSTPINIKLPNKKFEHIRYNHGANSQVPFKGKFFVEFCREDKLKQLVEYSLEFGSLLPFTSTSHKWYVLLFTQFYLYIYTHYFYVYSSNIFIYNVMHYKQFKYIYLQCDAMQVYKTNRHRFISRRIQTDQKV